MFHLIARYVEKSHMNNVKMNVSVHNSRFTVYYYWKQIIGCVNCTLAISLNSDIYLWNGQCKNLTKCKLAGEFNTKKGA